MLVPSENVTAAKVNLKVAAKFFNFVGRNWFRGHIPLNLTLRSLNNIDKPLTVNLPESFSHCLLL